MSEAGHSFPQASSPAFRLGSPPCDAGSTNYLRRRRARQRFERSVCPVPRPFEVAAVEHDECVRDFEDRIRLIGERLTTGVRKSRFYPANRFELAEQYTRRRCRRLTEF